MVLVVLVVVLVVMMAILLVLVVVLVVPVEKVNRRFSYHRVLKTYRSLQKQFFCRLRICTKQVFRGSAFLYRSPQNFLVTRQKTYRNQQKPKGAAGSLAEAGVRPLSTASL